MNRFHDDAAVEDDDDDDEMGGGGGGGPMPKPVEKLLPKLEPVDPKPEKKKGVGLLFWPCIYRFAFPQNIFQNLFLNEALPILIYSKITV